MTEGQSPRLGIVVIGRNEGERLRTCLASVVRSGYPAVYVDSGSTDQSQGVAAALGVPVINLDLSIPFTAARARNQGFSFLFSRFPRLTYAHFVDGDCEIVDGWLESAQQFLEQHADVGVVFGRRRERFIHDSVFNRLCDMEWDTPAGEARHCGGDALMRVGMFSEARGYAPELVAGEEPELCVRLRAAGWRIWRLDCEMTRHDAAMTRFGQWWKRSERAGYAYAHGAYLHGGGPERHWVRESLRSWGWGLGIPLATILLLGLVGGAALLLLLAYPLQVARLAAAGRYDTSSNWARAFFLVLGKFPEVLGQIRFHWHRLTGRRGTLIEYKRPA